MNVRIGIDVGGTFTDAVVIDNDSFELMGTIKVPTTHSAPEGVAAGIVQALHKVMEAYAIQPEDVMFIAHGTTQATNALLEGDVAQVGVITLGRGLEGVKSKGDTNVGSIELGSGKHLQSFNEYADTSDPDALLERIRQCMEKLVSDGAASIVAAEAFSVDDPENEDAAVQACTQSGLPATATNDISKLYGLKIRTRTAVVNASIMPKMLETANMTQSSILSAGIKSPLMVMRCDGGVMTVDEVRSRPILTILSGPAAGVAGALMYEKLTDGIFLEVGGTSTDISCVKDGKVMIRYAEVGGHKTYLNSLDVRTVGIGGGSMVELKDGQAVNTGPRSAHIAGLAYEVYSEPQDIVNPHLVEVHPKESDPAYACIECDNGVKVALTLAGAANLAGFVEVEDYARGNLESARRAWQPLADSMGCSVGEAAEKVLGFAAEKNGKVVSQLVSDYEMNKRNTLLVGGGGGASCVVGHLSKKMGYRHKVALNAPVISTVGVALAMVRDMVERIVIDPSDADIISIRREAEQKAIRNGAAPETVEVNVTVDNQRNLVRAIATGATEMRSKNLLDRILPVPRLLEITAENLGVDVSVLNVTAQNESMYAIQYDHVEKKVFGLFRNKSKPLRLIDEEGVIRLQRADARAIETTVEEWQTYVAYLLRDMTVYDDSGAVIPNIHIAIGKKLVDLSGLSSQEQLYTLAGVELAGYDLQQKIILVSTIRNSK